MANTIFKRVFSETVARIYEYGVKIHAVTQMAESNLCDSFNAFCFSFASIFMLQNTRKNR